MKVFFGFLGFIGFIYLWFFTSYPAGSCMFMQKIYWIGENWLISIPTAICLVIAKWNVPRP